MLGLRQRFQLLLKNEESPHRTALSFAVGVWVAFFPILGIHTGLALFIAFLFRLSRVPILLGTWVNNPWTIAPMYTAGTLLGCALLGVSPGAFREIDWHAVTRGSWADTVIRVLQVLRPYWWPYAVGNTLLGIATAGVAYLILRTVLERRRSAGGKPQPAAQP
jgi:uncharacterized protein (DUF2062 family)